MPRLDKHGRKKLSRALTYVLRHACKAEGVILQPDGYAPVAEILRHLRLTQLHATRQAVKQVVREETEKQRFILMKRNGQRVIKAIQGHTVGNVEVGLVVGNAVTRVEALEMQLYHVTHHANMRYVQASERPLLYMTDPIKTICPDAKTYH